MTQPNRYSWSSPSAVLPEGALIKHKLRLSPWREGCALEPLPAGNCTATVDKAPPTPRHPGADKRLHTLVSPAIHHVHSQERLSPPWSQLSSGNDHPRRIKTWREVRGRTSSSYRAPRSAPVTSPRGRWRDARPAGAMALTCCSAHEEGRGFEQSLPV